MANTIKDSIKTRKIAVLVADGVNELSVQTVKDMLEAKGAVVELVAPKLGSVISENDVVFSITKSFLTTASVLYDAVYVPGGINSVAALAAEPDAIHFLNEAFKHCKPIAADTQALQVIEETYFYKKLPGEFTDEVALTKGIIIANDINKLVSNFVSAIAMHRFWDREKLEKIPA